MNYQIITPDLWVLQPWANGGGITHEILAKRDDDGIIWRLSIATVKEDGPFSILPGIDRVIMLVDGNGFKLKFGESEYLMNEPFKPFAFKGETLIYCQLRSGQSRDFNIMTRNSLIQPQVNVNIYPANQLHTLRLEQDTFIFILSGNIKLTINNQELLLLQQKQLVYFQEPINIEHTAIENSATILFLQLIKTNS